MKRGPLLWIAIIVPIWGVLSLCAHWEPILRDGWGHYQWHRQFETTPATLWTFARDTYLHNNPRLGQVLTLLLYTPGPYHVVMTPVVELLLFWILTVLALGRRPQLANANDALMYFTITAMVTIAAPQIGPMLFYRPFTGNYVFGFVVSGCLLIPYRLHAETPHPHPWWWTVGMVVLGGCAGMANEHTGPTVALVIAVAIAWFARRGERIAPWMIAGWIGLVAGGLALYYAPGQAIRYSGLANQAMIDRITDRTERENASVVLSWLVYARTLIPWLLLAGVAHWRARGELTTPPRTKPQQVSALALAVSAVSIAVTLLASPKQGPRLYFAPMCLLCTALASAVVPTLQQRATRIAAWGLATIALAYVGYCLVTTYRTVGGEFAGRLRAIETGAPHSTVTVTPYSVPRSRWFVGEDFGADGLRSRLALQHGLAAIVLDRSAAPIDPQRLGK